jgi:hypothetical protein
MAIVFMDRQPTRRVILLGASNLVRSISTVVETARQIWQQPVEIMAAIGHGRSYGQDSRVLGRKISGIFPCALWKDLQSRPPLPTAALVTDVGNDIGYGVPVTRLVEWVDGCLDQLERIEATTVITQVPLASLARLSVHRYELFRRVLFPSCSLQLAEVIARASELNDELLRLGGQRKISVIPVSGAWYGFDPIHLKRSAWQQAWPQILSAWRDADQVLPLPRASFARWAYLRSLAPAEHTVLGWTRRCAQPCGVLVDGTTISLY